MFDPEKVKRGNIDLTGDEVVLASDYDRLLALYRAARRTAEYWKAENLATNVELARFSEMDINIAIRFDDAKGIELFIIPDSETAKIMARREGGLPV